MNNYSFKGQKKLGFYTIPTQLEVRLQDVVGQFNIVINGSFGNFVYGADHKSQQPDGVYIFYQVFLFTPFYQV